MRRTTKFPSTSRSPTHAQPALRLPPFRPVHIRLLELKGISNRPRCAPVHDQGIHDRLVRDVQQIHRAYPELHSGNIHCGRLYGDTKYAVQRHPREREVSGLVRCDPELPAKLCPQVVRSITL